jgi:hypothetical protein
MELTDERKLMGQPMPHHLEKGAFFSAIEKLYNTVPSGATDFTGLTAHRKAMIKNMETNKTPFGPLFQQSLQSNSSFPGYHEAERHIQHEWFSRTPERGITNGSWDAGNSFYTNSANLPPNSSVLSQPLEHWPTYWGDIEGIVFRTLLEGLYRSLGLDRKDFTDKIGTLANALAPHCWPIELLHICGPAWPEGWVTWKRVTPWAHGHVTIVFITPNSEHAADPTVAEGHDPQDRENGMTLVTHAEHAGYVRETSVQSSMYTDEDGDGVFEPKVEFPNLTIAPIARAVRERLTVIQTVADHDWAQANWRAERTLEDPVELVQSGLMPVPGAASPIELFTITDANVYAVATEAS